MMHIEAVVFLGKKAHRAVVAALDDVPGTARKAQAGAARYGLKEKAAWLMRLF
jgi:hypothetical protein